MLDSMKWAIDFKSNPRFEPPESDVSLLHDVVSEFPKRMSHVFPLDVSDRRGPT
jgi:hypothetical protein